MAESKMNDIIKSTIDGAKSFTDTDAVVGNAIHTPSGVTVIPVSKLSVGFAGGGIDFAGKKSPVPQSFGTGSGSGINITPIAFLTISPDAKINLIHIDKNPDTSVEKITSLIEHSPDILQKIKDTFI